jgi:SAP domain-containing ribonucleoprotein
MESKLQALKVTDLKKLLQDANLPVSGAKAELVKRLLENPAATSSMEGGEEEDLLGEYEAEPAAKEEPSTAVPASSATTAPTVTTEAAKSSPAPNTTTSATPTPAATTESEEDRKAALVAELEKRKARAARWGTSTEDADAKLQRALKFGVEATKDSTLDKLEGGLKGGKGRKENKTEAKPTNGDAKPKAEKVAAPVKPVETEKEKAAREERQAADEAAKKRRAERFGIQTTTTPKPDAPQKEAVAVDPLEEERKRKRMEKFGTPASAEVSKIVDWLKCSSISTYLLIA